MRFIAQTVNWTTFRSPIPAVAQFFILGFNLKKYWIFQLGEQGIASVSEKNINKKTPKICSKISITFKAECFLRRRNTNFKISMKRHMEIGLLWRAPLSKLKYWVVVPPFITNKSWTFDEISIHVISTNFRKTKLRKPWSMGSKVLFIIARF